MSANISRNDLSMTGAGMLPLNPLKQSKPSLKSTIKVPVIIITKDPNDQSTDSRAILHPKKTVKFNLNEPKRDILRLPQIQLNGHVSQGLSSNGISSNQPVVANSLPPSNTLTIFRRSLSASTASLSISKRRNVSVQTDLPTEMLNDSNHHFIERQQKLIDTLVSKILTLEQKLEKQNTLIRKAQTDQKEIALAVNKIYEINFRQTKSKAGF